MRSMSATRAASGSSTGPERSSGGAANLRPDASWLDGDQPGAALLDDHAWRARLTACLQPGVAGAECRMPGERQFLAGREDADPVVGLIVVRLEHERGLGQVRPVGEAAHLLGAEPVGAEHDSKRVALVGRVGEDVDLAELPQHGLHLSDG